MSGQSSPQDGGGGKVGEGPDKGSVDIEGEVGRILAGDKTKWDAPKGSLPEQKGWFGRLWGGLDRTSGRRSRLVAIVLLLVVILMLALIVGFTRESCEQDEAADLPGGSSQPTSGPTTAVSQGETTSPTTGAAADGYTEALQALGLDKPQTTTSGYVPDSSQVSGLGVWDFTWVDASGAPLGEIGTLTFLKGEEGPGSGTVTMAGSDALGAYKTGMSEGGSTTKLDWGVAGTQIISGVVSTEPGSK